MTPAVPNKPDTANPNREGATTKEGHTFNRNGELIEVYEGQWRVVVDASRSGWWRFHEHYNRSGYCDDPARGY